MITFEEFLKGVSTIDITEEELEQLEEAYTPEMKKFIPKEELPQIGAWLNKKLSISVQNTEFTDLGNPPFKMADLKPFTHAIVISKKEAVQVIKKESFGTKFEIVYGGFGMFNAARLKNAVKLFAFTVDGNFGYSQSGYALQQKREKQKEITDPLAIKAQEVNAKNSVKTNPVVKKIVELCKKQGFKINSFSRYEEEGESSFHLHITKKTFAFRLKCNENGNTFKSNYIFQSSTCNDKQEFEAYKKELDEFISLAKELESMTPILKEKIPAVGDLLYFIHNPH